MTNKDKAKRSRRKTGVVLRKARHRAELSLTELGALIGVSAQYISDVERGERSVSANRISVLAQAIKMTSEEQFLLFKEAECLPPKVEKRMRSAPEAWNYDMKKVVTALKAIRDDSNNLKSTLRGIADEALKEVGW